MTQEKLFQKIIASEAFKKLPLKQAEKISINTGDLKNKEIYAYKYSNEEIVICLKTKITYKGNFEALLYHTFQDIKNYIFTNNNRQYLSISEAGIFEELYIKKRLSDQFMEIYFDLF